MNRMQQRAMALSGAGFVILAIVGNEVLGKAGEAPAIGAPAGETVAFLVSLQGSFDLAVGVELVALASLVVFFAFLATRLRAAGARAASMVVAVAGAAMAAVKVASAPALVAAVHGAGTLPDELVLTLVQMNDIAFATTWPLLGTVLLTVAASWRTAAVPRAVAFAAAPIGIGLLLVPLGGTIGGNFLPMLLAMLWLLATSITVAIRRPVGEVVGAAWGGAAPTPASV